VHAKSKMLHVMTFVGISLDRLEYEETNPFKNKIKTIFGIIQK
jgi:hypothetical protein